MSEHKTKSPTYATASQDMTEALAPVREGLELVEKEIEQVAEVEFPMLGLLLQHILSTKGKRIRPAITLFSAGFGDYPVQRLVKLGAAIELLHTATLVHDDLIDDAKTRRGVPAIHTFAPERAAILVGDYLFAKAAALCTETYNVRVMYVFGHTLMTICDGELRQIYSKLMLDQSREVYYKKIESKTAALFRTAAETGAILSGVDDDTVSYLRDYGYNLGMAFQIVDDVLDFISDEKHLGKPAGADLLHGTITLPAILLLEQDVGHDLLTRILEEDDQHHILIQEFVQLVRNSSAIDQAMEAAEQFSRRASEAVAGLPDNSSKRSLLRISEYVLQRTH